MREQFVKVEIRVYLVSALFTYSLTFDVIKEKDLCGKNVLKNYICCLIFTLNRFNFNFLNIYRIYIYIYTYIIYIYRKREREREKTLLNICLTS